MSEIAQDVQNAYCRIVSNLLDERESIHVITQEAGSRLREEFPERSSRQLRRDTQNFRSDGTVDPSTIQAHTQPSQEFPYYPSDKENVYYMPHRRAMITVDHETVDEILHRYCDLDHTIEEITLSDTMQNVGLSEDDVRYIRDVHEKTHGSDPFTDEQKERMSVEELAETSWGRIEAQYNREMERKKLREYEKAWKWKQKFEANHVQVWEEYFKEQSVPNRVERIEPKQYNNSDLCLVMGLADTHFGSPAWTLEEARERILTNHARVIHRADESAFGPPSEHVLALCGDIFHTDSDDGRISKGLQIETGAHPQQAVESGMRVLSEVVQRDRERADHTRVVGVPGNHDRMLTTPLMVALQMQYEDVEDVTVEYSWEQPRDYMQWGSTLVGLTHGSEERIKNLPEIMASEAKEFWGDTNFRIFLFGDNHHPEVDGSSAAGVWLWRLPAQMPVDQHAKRGGYVGAVRGMNGFLFDKRDGLIDFIPVLNFD